MARVTVEDCLKHTESRFTLILEASKRARAISQGSMPWVEEENDKPTVIALREIASNITEAAPLNVMTDETSSNS